MPQNFRLGQRYVYNISANVVIDAFYIGIKAHVEVESNDSLPLAQWRPCHLNCRLPAHYRDYLREPPRPLPPAEARGNLDDVRPLNLSHPPSASPPYPVPHLPLLPSRPKIKTQPNSFGLFWLYDEDSLPINDPDTENLLDEAGPFVTGETSSKLNKGITDANNPFYPYPNETSLLLGDWYWNQGHQKSQAGFKKLLDIIGDPEYHPDDVRNTNWTVVNQKLGDSSAQDDKTEGKCEWSNEDSGWKKATVWICTPFHHRAWHPGPKEYSIEGFHHRSLVDIIRENVSDPSHHRLFHYEPYELCWQPPHKAKDVRVYGELYTS